MPIVGLERAMGAGVAAGRAVVAVPRGLARRGAPLVGRVAGVAGPDRVLALARYRDLAAGYDVRTATGDPYRRQTVDAPGADARRGHPRRRLRDRTATSPRSRRASARRGA